MEWMTQGCLGIPAWTPSLRLKARRLLGSLFFVLSGKCFKRFDQPTYYKDLQFYQLESIYNTYSYVKQQFPDFNPQPPISDISCAN